MLTPAIFFFFFYYPSYKIYESITKMEKIKYKYKIENLIIRRKSLNRHLILKFYRLDNKSIYLEILQKINKVLQHN